MTLIYAHRGASAMHPENTLRAFRQALASGVDGIPLARLETLDAGNGERVPTLAEVLALVGDAAHLDVEIKGTGIERAVLDVLAQYPAVRWAISSFDWDTLRTVRRLDPMAEVWPLAERVDDEL